MNIIYSLSIIVLFFTIVLSKDYPEKTLKCYSYLTKPDKKLICPAARSRYCVKEVTTLTQNLCGQTQYFGDLYEQSICQFKKCSAQCEEGNYDFEYQGQKYTRSRYCCDTDYCNSALGGVNSMISLFLVVVSVISALVYLL